MVAVRPTFHNPALLAKQAASIDVMSHGRLTLNVVSSWWKDEATKYGVHFDEHDDRYARTSEWLDVVNGCWSEQGFSYKRQVLRCARQRAFAEAGEQAAADVVCGWGVGRRRRT